MARLILKEGRGIGRVYELEGDESLIGRSAECPVQVFDDKVSRRHAVIEREGGRCRVRDLDSKNGLLVNGTACRTQALFDWDEIQVGDSVLVFLSGEENWPRSDEESGGISSTIQSAYPYALVGSSEPMEQVRSLIEKAVRSQAPVVIAGETGTGKELAARAIHSLSSRGRGPFVPVNCAAVPDPLAESELFGHEKGAFTGAVERRIGKFELATDGSLFLDEVGEASLPLQAKLLRVLDGGMFERVGGTEPIRTNARILCATNRSLQDRVERGKFRQDLLFRLRVLEIGMPPLRERMEDLSELIRHFVDSSRMMRRNRPIRFSPQALDRMAAYGWPGNVRELRNIVERMIVINRSGTVTPEDLPAEIASPAPSERTYPASDRPGARSMKEMERDHIIEVLREVEGNKTHAARILGIDKKTLYTKIKGYDIDADVL